MRDLLRGFVGWRVGCGEEVKIEGSLMESAKVWLRWVIPEVSRLLRVGLSWGWGCLGGGEWWCWFFMPESRRLVIAGNCGWVNWNW